MVNNFELPILISVRPSKWLKFWLCSIHMLAIPVVFMTDLVWYVEIVLVIAVCISLIVVTRNYIYRQGPNSIVSIMLSETDEWWLTTESDETFKAGLLPAALVHPLLVALQFRARDRNYNVILTPDAVDKDMLRRLRVRLRFQRQHSVHRF
jgi:toxin CptA